MKKCFKERSDGECYEKRGCEGCFYYKEVETDESDSNNFNNMYDNNNTMLYGRE